MAYSTVNIPTSFTTDAEFRAFCSAVDSAITGLGLVNTSDTGQVNLSTAVLPSGTGVSGPSTTIYYKIYRFADSLQSSKPVFIRVEFYSSANLATRPRVKFKVGTGTDGAGNLSGNPQGYFDMDPGGGSSNSQVSYVSGGTNRMTLCMWAGDSSATYRGQFITVERSKAADGTDSNESIIMYAHNSNFTQAAASLNFSSSAANSGPAALSLAYNASSILQDSKKAVYSIWPPASFTHGPFHGVVLIETGDLPTTQGTAFDCAIDSSGVKNWIPLPPSGAATSTPTGGSNQSRLCMRYGPDGNTQSTAHTPIPPIASSGGGGSPTVPTTGRIWPRQR